MSATPFPYKDKDQALFDLKLFSRMSYNEDKVIYLFKNNNGEYFISREMISSQTPEAMAINDTAYLPSQS